MSYGRATGVKMVLSGEGADEIFGGANETNLLIYQLRMAWHIDDGFTRVNRPQRIGLWEDWIQSNTIVQGISCLWNLYNSG